MPRLRRMSDGAGDCGSRSEAIRYDENGRNPQVIGRKPIVGACMLVGSVTARSYSRQDYWITTPVVEILEESENYCMFKTTNSKYEWWDRY